MPSMPASAARRASSGCSTPLRTIGPAQCSRRNGSRSQLLSRAGEHRHPVQHGRRSRSSSGGRGEAGPERRIGERDRGADAAQERQVRPVEVVRAPGQRPGVEGDHQRREAGRLRPVEQAGAYRVVVGPVELVPPRAGAAGLGDLLDGVRRRGRQHHRQAQRGGGPGRGELAVRVQDRLHADRCDQHRRRHGRCPAPSWTGRGWSRRAASAARSATGRTPPGWPGRSRRCRPHRRRTRTGPGSSRWRADSSSALGVRGELGQACRPRPLR